MKLNEELQGRAEQIIQTWAETTIELTAGEAVGVMLLATLDILCSTTPPEEVKKMFLTCIEAAKERENVTEQVYMTNTVLKKLLQESGNTGLQTAM